MKRLKYKGITASAVSVSAGEIARTIKIDLPPGLVYHDRGGIGKIEAAIVGAHGQFEPLVGRPTIQYA